MSQKTKNTYRFYLVTLALTAIVTVALRTAALFTVFDPEIGFYRTPTLSIATAVILCATAVLLSVLTHELRELFVFAPDYRDLPTLLSGSFLAIADLAAIKPR